MQISISSVGIRLCEEIGCLTILIMTRQEIQDKGTKQCFARAQRADCKSPLLITASLLITYLDA